MIHHIINIHQEIKNNQQIQLSPLPCMFRIQFGPNIREKSKLIKTWIKSTITFRHRRKVGLINPPHPRYHYKRARGALKFYKFMFLKYKIYKCSTINIILKSMNSGYISIRNLISFSSQKIVLFKNLYQKGAKKYRRGVRSLKLKYNKIFLFYKKKKYLFRRRLPGRIFFVNSWINFFHQFNLKRLSTTVSKKNFRELGLKRFFHSWNIRLAQTFFCIYSFFSLYIFKSVFLKKRKKKHSFCFNKNLICLVSISYKNFSFIINLLFSLKSFFNLIYIRLFTVPENSLAEQKNYKLDAQQKNISRKKKRQLFFRKIMNIPDLSLRRKNINLDTKFNLLGKKLKVVKQIINSFFKNKKIIFSSSQNLHKIKCVNLNLNFLKNISFSSDDNSQFLIKKPRSFFIIKIISSVNTKKARDSFLKDLYLWLFLKKSFNETIYRKLFNPYNVWLFFINYALNYYLFSKLYFVFLNYFFYIIVQKFNQISKLLKLTKFELGYDFIKLRDHARYHLGIRPQSFVTTFNRRAKKGFQ